MKPYRRWWAAMLILASMSTGCGTGSDTALPTAVPTPVPSDADRPTATGGVVRRCGSHYAEEFDAGLEARTVTVGAVSLVSFRLAPAPSPPGEVRTFKVLVRLAAQTDARLETTTPGTTLLYDRARFPESSHRALSAGESSVQFIGCSDRPAVFNGSILTTGPTSVALRVDSGAGHRDLVIAAYTG